jgi:hypothetical protein
VVDQDQGVTTTQLARWPVPQRDPLDLHAYKAADPVLVVALVRYDRGWRSVKVAKKAPRVSGLSEGP